MVSCVYRSSAATGRTPPTAADTSRRARVPPPPTRMRNGAPNTSGRRAVAAMPSNRPASTCERSSGQTAARQPPPPSSGASGRTGAVSARASWRRATPTASSAKITATMWARYQVLPTAAAHHHTVPVANRTVASARTASRIRRPPSIHHATPTPIAARATAIASWSTRSPIAATNGSSTSAGQGRERQQHLPRRLPARVEQRVDVVEVPVRRSVGAVRDRPVERNLSVQEGVRLPDEMVVLVVVLGVGPRVQGQRTERQQQPDNDGREATGAGLGREGPVRALGYTPVHLQRCVGGSPCPVWVRARPAGKR